MSTMTYLGWQLEKRQGLAREIQCAVHRFEERCGCPPTELLAPLGSGIAWPGLPVREQRNVPAGQVWPGADLQLVERRLPAERAA